MPYRFTAALLMALALTACASTSAGPIPTPTHAVAARPSKALGSVAGSYAALGASETYGVGAEPYTKGYAYLVAHTLHAHPFVDLGIPGSTLDAAYQSEVTGALAIRPQLCTAFFGFNDLKAGVSRSAFLSDLKDLVVTLRRSSCHVLIIGLPDLSVLPAVRQSGIVGINLLVTSWNAGMRKVAKHNGAHFLDLSGYSRELAAHPEYISSDGLHPSNAGHRRLAAVVVQAIRKFGLFRRS